MAVHSVKIEPVKFELILAGSRKFEVRKDETGFKPGDLVTLKEWNDNQYTGRELTKKLGFVIGLNWLRPQDSDIKVFSLVNP